MRKWRVDFDDEFDAEFMTWPEEWQDKVYALARMLEEGGPALTRPYSDTLKGTAVANLKELRASTRDAEIRVLYAFDPKRNAILLVGGSKRGISTDLFYSRFIRIAESRWLAHLARLKRG